MKILLLIYIPFILVYIYLYANIYSNNKNEYNKIILDNDYYKKIIAQLFLEYLPLILIFFNLICSNNLVILSLIFLAIFVSCAKYPLINFINIHKGKYYIVKDTIDYKIELRHITENKKHKMLYYFRLKNYYKLILKDIKIDKKLYDKFEEKNKVYVIFDNKGNLINIYSAKEKIESEKLKEKIFKYEKIEYFNKKYIDNKTFFNKDELNKIKEKEYKEILLGNKIITLIFLVLTVILIYKAPKSGYELLTGVLSFIYFAVSMHYYVDITKFITANNNNEIKVKVEKITEMTDYVNSLGKIGIKVEGQEYYSSVPQTQLGKAKEGSMIYAFYYNDELYLALDTNQYVISKEFPVEKE